MVALDLIWSSIFGAVLLLAMLGLRLLMTDSAEQYATDLRVQESVADFTVIMENDFGKIGYRETTGQKMITAEADTLLFRGDVNDDGVVDLVKYYKGTTAQMSKTPNPNDFILYRVIAPGDTTKINVGLTNFQFTYYDSTGATTTNPSIVRGLKVVTNIENAYKNSDNTYSGVYYENRYYPVYLSLP